MELMHVKFPRNAAIINESSLLFKNLINVPIIIINAQPTEPREVVIFLQ